MPAEVSGEPLGVEPGAGGSGRGRMTGLLALAFEKGRLCENATPALLCGPAPALTRAVWSPSQSIFLALVVAKQLRFPGKRHTTHSELAGAGCGMTHTESLHCECFTTSARRSFPPAGNPTPALPTAPGDSSHHAI